MSNVNVQKYWLRCACGIKLAKVTKDSKGGAFIDCKKCKREVEIKFEGQTEKVESACTSVCA